MSKRRVTATAPAVVESRRYERGAGSRTYGIMPHDLDQTRAEIMQQAGFSPELLVKAKDALEQALEAKRKFYASHLGYIKDERADPDFHAILKATQQLLKLYQLLDGGQRSSAPRPVQVQVNVAPWVQQAQGKRRRYRDAINAEVVDDKPA